MCFSLFVLLLAAAEPERAGRPLSAWVTDLSSSSFLVREEALEVLAQFGPDGRPALDAVRPLLKAPQPKTRLRAAVALWKIEGKSDALVPALTEASRETRRETRLLVLDVVQKMGPLARQASVALVECLADGDQQVWIPAQQTLMRLEMSALPALTDGLKHEDHAVKRHVLSLLTGLGPRAASAAPAILELAKHSDAEVRRLSLNFLLLAAPQLREAIPLFEAVLKDKGSPLRLQAAGALWEADRRTKDVLPVLIEALKDRGNIGARQQAAHFLSKMGPAAKEAVPVLIELARSAQAGEQALEVGTILGRMRPLPLEYLEPLLTDKEARLRETAVAALRWASQVGAAGDAGAAALARALPKVSEREQIGICEALAMSRQHGRAAAPALALALKAKDAKVVAAAARALWEIGPAAEPALPAALDILKDAKHPLAFRLQAGVILGKIGPAAKPAVPALVELLKNRELSGRQYDEIAQALGTIGPAAAVEALPALVELSKAGTPLGRARALESIWNIDPGHPAIVQGFVSLLQADNQRGTPMLLQFLHCLGLCGDDVRPAVPLLIDGFKLPGLLGYRQVYVQTLGQIGPGAREGIPALKAQLAEKDVNYRGEVAAALVRLGAIDSEVLAALGASVQAPNSYFRMTALQILGELGTRGGGAAESVLQSWRVEHLPFIRIQLAEAAASLDPKAAREMVPWLQEQMRVSGSAEGVRAAAVLLAIEPGAKDALPLLLRTLRGGGSFQENDFSRFAAAQALGRIGPAAREAVPDLLAALKAVPDPKAPPEENAAQEFHAVSIRLAAAHALWRIEPKQKDKVLAVLLALLREDGFNNFPYTGQSIGVLALMGPDAAEALPALAEAFRKGQQGLRRPIIDAVRKIDPKGIGRLRPESRSR